MVIIGRSKESRKKSRRFLQAVYDEGGVARTSEIRRRSGLSRSDVKYRYKSLEDVGLITIEYDEQGVAGPNESAQKIAVLTELAQEEIENKRLLQNGHSKSEHTVYDAEEAAAQMESLANRIENQEQEIEQLQEYITDTLYQNIRMLRWSIARLEVVAEKEGQRLDSIQLDDQLTALRRRARDFSLERNSD